MFYKLKFHSMDFYQKFFDENGQPNMKGYLENALFSILRKAEKERYLKDIFYAILEADHQDFELLLAYPDMVKPGDELIYALLDQFNAISDDEMMSRLVDPGVFGIEAISSEEFFNKLSQYQSRLFSVEIELKNIQQQKAYEWQAKYDKIIHDHPELKENS